MSYFLRIFNWARQMTNWFPFISWLVATISKYTNTLTPEKQNHTVTTTSLIHRLKVYLWRPSKQPMICTHCTLLFLWLEHHQFCRQLAFCLMCLSLVPSFFFFCLVSLIAKSVLESVKANRTRIESWDQQDRAINSPPTIEKCTSCSVLLALSASHWNGMSVHNLYVHCRMWIGNSTNWIDTKLVIYESQTV